MNTNRHRTDTRINGSRFFIEEKPVPQVHSRRWNVIMLALLGACSALILWALFNIAASRNAAYQPGVVYDTSLTTRGGH